MRADHNYRDLDVLTVGPIVNDLSASFDMFWNSEWAIPIAAVVDDLPNEQDLADLRKRLQEKITATGYPYPINENSDEVRSRLVQIRDSFIWARGQVFVEQPSRVNTDATAGVISNALAQRAKEAEHEILIESPYFVLLDRTVEAIRQLRARGVRVRALTNSAASNDVVAAHAGYANTRTKLLKAGVELYELRPDTNMKRDWSVLAGKSRAALHAKSVVFDRKSVFIGSFNLDPRSTAINTEIGVMIHSAEIAGQVGELMDEGVNLGSAFRVTLDTNDDLAWTTENDGKKVEYDTDPETSTWYRFLVGVVRLLPIESQL